MKSILLITLLAGAVTARPENDPGFVISFNTTNLLEKFLPRLAKLAVSGLNLILTPLDPINIIAVKNEIKVSNVIKLGLMLKQLEFSGYSDLQLEINELMNEAKNNSVAIQLTLPQLGVVSDEAIVYFNNLNISVSGNVKVSGVGVKTTVGFVQHKVESLQIHFLLDDIQSNLNVLVFGNDYSGIVDVTLNNIIPMLFEDNAQKVADTLAAIILSLIKKIQG